MTTRRLHRDTRVTLRALCESLKENPHYVSQVINQDLATNFYDLIKKHRVEDAMTALVTEPDKSVLDIALAVGFNSKSTFNAAFRQHAGHDAARISQLTQDRAGSRADALSKEKAPATFIAGAFVLSASSLLTQVFDAW